MAPPSPPPLRAKVLPPPPPAPLQVHQLARAGPSSPGRARPDSHVVPVSPSPSPSTPTHRSTLSVRSAQQNRAPATPRSRTTSVDFGRSDPFGDCDADASHPHTAVPLLPTSSSSSSSRYLNLDKDVPDIPDDEQQLLPSSSSPSASRKRPRRGDAARASDRTRRCARWFLVVVAGAAGVVVLLALLTTDDTRASAKGKVDEAVQAVGGWVGVGTATGPGGSSAAGGGQVAYGRGGDGDEVTLEDGERVVYRNALCALSFPSSCSTGPSQLTSRRPRAAAAPLTQIHTPSRPRRRTTPRPSARSGTMSVCGSAGSTSAGASALPGCFLAKRLWASADGELELLTSRLTRMRPQLAHARALHHATPLRALPRCTKSRRRRVHAERESS